MAEEIGSKLGFDAAQAIASIQKLKKELDSYNAQLAKIATGSKGFNTEQAKADDILKRLSTSSQIAVGHLKALGVTQAQLTSSTKQLTAARAAATSEERAEQALRQKSVTLSQQQAAAELRTARAKAQANRTGFQRALGIDPTSRPTLNGDQIGEAAAARRVAQLKATEAALRNVGRQASVTGQQLNEGLTKGTQAARGFDISLRSIVRILAVQFVARGFANLVSEFTSGIKAARGFEIQLGEILTISKEFQNQGIDAVGEVVQRLSAQFGRPVEDVAKGLYQTLSNQIGDAAESTRFLADSLEFSVAAVTSSADAVDLLSGVLNAYNLTAASTTRISDELFKTIELGRVTGTELANTYGRITTLSAQLGVSTAEVNAAIAELTINGVKASDALTQVSNLFLKLVQPSDNTKKAFDELNVASAEAGIAIFTLEGFLQKLAGNKTALSEIAELLGGRIRAIRGASTLLTNAERLNKTLIEIEQSTGATRKAFELIDATNAQKLTKSLQEMRGVLINDVGRTAIKVFVDLTSAVGGTTRALEVLATAGGSIVAGGLLIFISQVVTSLRALGIVAQGTAASLALLKFAALAAVPVGIVLLVRELGKVRDGAGEAQKAIAKFQEQTDKDIKAKVVAALPDVKARQKAVTEETQIVGKGLLDRVAFLKQEQLANATSNKAITLDIINNVKDRSEVIKQSIKALESFIDDAKSRTKSLSSDIKSLLGDINKSQFERSVGGLDERGQTVARLREVDRLASEATRLSLSSDPEAQKQAVALLREAFTQSEKIADSVNFRRFGEKAINDLKSQALSIDKNIAATNARDARSAQGQLDKNKGLDAEITKTEQAQTKLAATSSRLKNDIENNTNNLIVFGEQFQQSIKAVDAGFDGIRTNLQDIRKQQVLRTAFFPGQDGSPRQGIKTAEQELAALERVREQARDLIRSQNTDGLKLLEDQLLSQSQAISKAAAKADEEAGLAAGFGKAVKDVLFGDSDAAIQASIKGLANDLAQARSTIAKQQKAEGEQSDLQNQAKALSDLSKNASDNAAILQQLPTFLKDIGTGGTEAGTGLREIGTSSPAAVEGLNSVQGAVNSFDTSNIQNQTAAALASLAQLAAASQAVGGGAPAANAYFGGRMGYFAGGGSARGMDTIPAMLSKGEFVVNAKSSRNFFSQLQAINSGRRPNFRQSGGEVTNVGDISVSVAGGDNSQQTINQIAKGLQRQIRQRRIKFKGR